MASPMKVAAKTRRRRFLKWLATLKESEKQERICEGINVIVRQVKKL
jgi:hypothetical protein